MYIMAPPPSSPRSLAQLSNDPVPTRTRLILRFLSPFCPPLQTVLSKNTLAKMYTDQSSSYLRVDTVHPGHDDHLYREISKSSTSQLCADIVNNDQEGPLSSAKVTPNDAYPIHPILSLPPELLSLIFIHCLPSSAQGRQELHPSTAPLLLTRICGAWRALALRTSALWASVAFELFQTSYSSALTSVHPVLHAPPLELQLRKLAWWLAQGAAHPLTLYLHYRQQLPEAVPLLMMHAVRLAEADLFLHPATLAAFNSAAATSGGELELPLLRRLLLGSFPIRSRFNADVEGAARITAFANAPRLTDVSLLKLPPSAVALPWTQLTCFHASFSLGQPPVPSLAPFAPIPAGGDQESEDSESDITHKSLTSLTLRTHPATPVPLSVFLGGGALGLGASDSGSAALLTLPSLSSLALPPLFPSDITTFATFASRSRLSHTLRELTLALAPLPSGAILTVLAPLKRLEKLELSHPGEEVLEDILSSLAKTIREGDGDAVESAGGEDGTGTDEDGDARTPFLPRLRELHVDCFRGKPPYAALQVALEARWDIGCASSRAAPGIGVTQLRSFVLTTLTLAPKTAIATTTTTPYASPSPFSHPDPDAEAGAELDADATHLAALRALKTRGMDVSVACVYGGSVV
ncbi:F-box domain-containing protein [Mycena venus]|uniref:F-box domain-containing protein n=1 Tax=Mycena venus TaxID=2733690 RepID=A0A8H6Y484_9AGAR|nr:F-box domain-containing protein [Mycena venus]